MDPNSLLEKGILDKAPNIGLIGDLIGGLMGELIGRR
jgi:hypothetical protein